MAMSRQNLLVPFTASAATYSTGAHENASLQAALLFAAIENFTLGLAIVNQDGNVVHQNKRAQNLLKQIGQPSKRRLPKVVWRACQQLIVGQQEHRDLFPPDCNVVLEDDIETPSHDTLTMRVQRFNWSDEAAEAADCFLVTIEDRQQTLAAAASQEAQRYGLTPRETDVWNLKRLGYSYKEISSELFIAENTVKKHIKNIYSKKQQATWAKA